MPSDFRAVIMAQLDDKSVAKEINDIGSKHKIVFNNISFDRTALSNAIQSALNGQNININLGNANFNTQALASQAQQIGNTIGQQLTKQINSNLYRVNVSHSTEQISKMQAALRDMKLDNLSIAKITQDLLGMDIVIQNIKTHFDKLGSISINVRGIDSHNNVVSIIKSVKEVETELANGTKATELEISNLGTNVIQNFAKQESQLQKNTAAAIKYRDQLATLNSRFTGEESKSRLFNETHVTEFNAALQNVYNTITQLETATAEQATVLKANISSQINAVNLLGQSFYNVELAERSDETQIQKNTVAVTGYLSKLEAITAKYSADSNKPIINPTNLSIVNSELDKVLNHVANLETATSKEAVTIKSNIDSEINSLNLLIQSLQRAENAEKVNAQQLAKNEAEIAKYKSTIEKLSYDAFNPNATKPLRDDGNINQLQSAFMQAIMSAEQLRNVDATTFTEMKSNVESEINSLKLLITSFQNAEYAASQLRAKPVETVKAEQLELLRVFIADINKAGISLNQFANVDINSLKGILQGVTNADGLKQYLNTLSVAKAEFKALRQEQSQFANATEVNIAINKMETWLRKNSKAAKTYGDEIRNLINNLKQMQAQGGVLPTDLKRITNGFTEMKTAAAAAGLTGRTFFQQILGAAKSLGRYFGVSTIVYRTFGTIKNGIKDIVDLDTALVDLKKTTDGTEAQLNSFYYTANESAKKLGVTTKEIISASADWSRLGLQYVSPLV